MRSLFRSPAPKSAAGDELKPAEFPSVRGADLAADFTARRVAGDFYDSVRVSPERVLFGLLDMAGPRQDNRHILIAAQETFRNAGAELFSPPDLNEADVMIELTYRINRRVLEMESGVRSCPAFLGCYHERFGTLCFSNAGHTPGLLRDNGGITELGSTGLPLGLFSHATSDARIIAVEKGAAVLLVSRGVISCEARPNRGSEEFGLGRVKQFFQNRTLTSAQDLCAAVLKSSTEFSKGTPVCDDRTALALLRKA